MSLASLGLAWELAAAALRGRMQYRVNFLTIVLFGFFYQTASYAFIWVVLARFDAIAGWTLGQVTFLYGLRLTVHGLYMVFFGGLTRVRWLVRQGDFDRYLVRPFPPLLQAITINLPPNAFGDLSGGLLLFGAAIAIAEASWTPDQVAFLALAIVGGVLLEGALQLIVATLAFRMIDTGSASYLISSFFDNMGNFPLSIYGNVGRALLTFVLPVAFVAYFPAAVIFGRTAELAVHPALAYAAPLVGLAWFAAAYWFWRRELRAYQSVGS